MKKWNDVLHQQSNSNTKNKDRPIKPQFIASAVSEELNDNAIVSVDSGTNTIWAARYIQMRKGMKFSVSGTLASMACGLPYALAAQVAYPERQCIAFVGDGGFSMLMADFVTAVKYQLPVKFVIIKNNTLGQIKWEQMVFLGNPEFGVELQPFDFVKFAEACGAAGFHAEAPDDLPRTLRAFLDAPGPALLEAVVDPYEPPMPPMVTFDPAEKMAKALARSEANRNKIAVTLFRDQIEDYAAKPGPLHRIAETVAGAISGNG